MTFLRVDNYEEDSAIWRTWGGVAISQSRKNKYYRLLLTFLRLFYAFEFKICGLALMTSTERDTSFGTTEVGHCLLATPIGDLMSPVTPRETKIVSLTGGTNFLGTTIIA